MHFFTEFNVVLLCRRQCGPQMVLAAIDCSFTMASRRSQTDETVAVDVISVSFSTFCFNACYVCLLAASA